MPPGVVDPPPASFLRALHQTSQILLSRDPRTFQCCHSPLCLCFHGSPAWKALHQLTLTCLLRLLRNLPWYRSAMHLFRLHWSQCTAMIFSSLHLARVGLGPCLIHRRWYMGDNSWIFVEGQKERREASLLLALLQLPSPVLVMGGLFCSSASHSIGWNTPTPPHPHKA